VIVVRNLLEHGRKEQGVRRLGIQLFITHCYKNVKETVGRITSQC
jgi:hypothetical protein